MVPYNTGRLPHRQYFYCNSTDIKPTSAYVGDRLYLLDTGKHEIWDGSAWVEYFSPQLYVTPTP